jgi:hypothetical protein
VQKDNVAACADVERDRMKILSVDSGVVSFYFKSADINMTSDALETRLSDCLQTRIPSFTALTTEVCKR